MRAPRAIIGVVVATLCAVATRRAGEQDAPVPVVAVGEGRSFSAAIASAIRMAVESGAGATVFSGASSSGDRLTADSVRSVSRGVVTRYALLDSARLDGGARVRILALVSRISERDAPGARAHRVPAPGNLWIANIALDSVRHATEGRLLSELFAAGAPRPNAYQYSIETGPPVRSGSSLRLRLRVIRTPAPAYTVLRENAFSLLAAVAGPAGTRTIHFPPLRSERIEVSPCVSHCDSSERQLLNARAALDASDPLVVADPPVQTAPVRAVTPTLFPDLRTVGGFAVAFTDSIRKRQQLVHVRSTRGYRAVTDYLRVTFDDARFHIDIGDRGLDLIESFRSSSTGQPEHRFTVTRGAGQYSIDLVRGFRPATHGGPGAATALGSAYVVLAVPAASAVLTDTALLDIGLSAAQMAAVSKVGVAPIGAQSTHDGASPVPGRFTRGDAVVPPEVVAALARPPLVEGDGAVAVPGLQSVLLAAGTGIVDPAAPTQACAVARLRAQRELVRFLTGSHLEGRIDMTSSEARGGQVQEQFRENISESVAGRLAGAALASQWTVNAPLRCRVALWMPDETRLRGDTAGRPPR